MGRRACGLGRRRFGRFRCFGHNLRRRLFGGGGFLCLFHDLFCRRIRCRGLAQHIIGARLGIRGLYGFGGHTLYRARHGDGCFLWRQNGDIGRRLGQLGGLIAHVLRGGRCDGFRLWHRLRFRGGLGLRRRLGGRFWFGGRFRFRGRLGLRCGLRLRGLRRGDHLVILRGRDDRHLLHLHRVAVRGKDIPQQ